VDNNAKLFRAGQMKVLKPYVDEGKIKIVGDQWVAWMAPPAVASLEATTASILLLFAVNAFSIIFSAFMSMRAKLRLSAISGLTAGCRKTR
jgi:ABC-type xylose transport system substrate-binding protein